MSFSRRKFNRLALMGGASFATSSSIFFPKPAEAYATDFSLRDFSTGNVFNRLQRLSAARSIPGVLTPILQGGSSSSGQIQPEAVSVIRSADRVLVNQQFTQARTELAQAGRGNTPSLLWGRQRRETLGTNVGFGFVQEYQDQFTDAKISGPAMAGIHNVQAILADQRLTPDEIAGSVLPVRSTFDDLGSWMGEEGSGVSFTQFRTALGLFTARYDLIQPGAGGVGEVRITLEAEDQPRRDILVTVFFA